MRLPLAAMLLILAAPAAAHKPRPADPGPEQVLRELGMLPDPEVLRAAIARAETEPLGSERNPVRVGGPSGEHLYIARLRCADGNAPRIGQRYSAGVGAFGTIVDVYPLDCGAAAPGQVSLVMDMYHSGHSENRAPPGFTIATR
jgi:hypothetical protein